MRGHVRVPVFIGLAVLAVLSLVELAFPRAKRFTFWGMVGGLVFLVAADVFYRVRATLAPAPPNEGPGLPGSDSEPPAPIQPS